MPEGLSNTAFGKLIGLTEGAVRKAAKQGRVKRFADGSIDEAASLKLWQDQADPARTGIRTVPRTGTGTVRAATRPEVGTFPVPAAYRDRADLGDAFARGALYGAHAVAYGVPTAAASAAIEAGAGRALALAIHDAARTDAAFLAGDVTEALGLTPPGTDDAGPHAPTAFQGFDPGTFPEAAP